MGPYWLAAFLWPAAVFGLVLLLGRLEARFDDTAPGRPAQESIPQTHLDQTSDPVIEAPGHVIRPA